MCVNLHIQCMYLKLFSFLLNAAKFLFIFSKCLKKIIHVLTYHISMIVKPLDDTCIGLDL